MKIHLASAYNGRASCGIRAGKLTTMGVKVTCGRCSAIVRRVLRDAMIPTRRSR